MSNNDHEQMIKGYIGALEKHHCGFTAVLSRTVALMALKSILSADIAWMPLLRDSKSNKNRTDDDWCFSTFSQSGMQNNNYNRLSFRSSVSVAIEADRPHLVNLFNDISKAIDKDATINYENNYWSKNMLISRSEVLDSVIYAINPTKKEESVLD